MSKREIKKRHANVLSYMSKTLDRIGKKNQTRPENYFKGKAQREKAVMLEELARKMRKDNNV